MTSLVYGEHGQFLFHELKKTESPSAETSNFLKQIIILKSFNSLFYLKFHIFKAI